MPIPVWILLAFAAWTLLVLIGSVGVYRWSRILTRRVEIGQLQFYDLEGHPDWYKRAIRAHGNCVENLPVYGAIVLAMVVSGVVAHILDTLAVAFLIARVVQSIVHVSVPQTNAVTTARFAFFFVQFVCMVWMGFYVAIHAA